MIEREQPALDGLVMPLCSASVHVIQRTQVASAPDLGQHLPSDSTALTLCAVYAHCWCRTLHQILFCPTHTLGCAVLCCICHPVPAGQNVGGCNDGPGVMTLQKEGKLLPMLKQAGALA
jgi:hypothetical protein